MLFKGKTLKNVTENADCRIKNIQNISGVSALLLCAMHFKQFSDLLPCGPVKRTYAKFAGCAFWGFDSKK